MASVMIVEDNPDQSEPLARFLEKCGHDTRCYVNGREALMALLTDKCDCVILDLLMPEMDGPTFLETIRSYLRLRAVPVIVLSALRDSLLLDKVRSQNVNAVLVKGTTTFDEIKRTLDEAVKDLPQ